MKAKEFVAKAKEIEAMKTLYKLGTFCNKKNGVFHLCDCSGLIKAIMWGYPSASRKYGTNGLSDINANTMIKRCTDVSTDFSKIEIGECVWMSGHIGIYVGDGLVIESSPKWENGVQYTACLNIGKKTGYNGRKWKKHGKMPWVDYSESVSEVSEGKKTVSEVAKEVVKGLWGNGSERKKALTKAGYDYKAVQKAVNKLL